MAGFWMACAGAAIVFFGNLLYLNRAAKTLLKKEEGFHPQEGDATLVIIIMFYSRVKGKIPAAIARIISQASITFDSMPHNSAIVLTLNACGVSHKEGYIHLFWTTVLMTTLATVACILLATVGIV